MKKSTRIRVLEIKKMMKENNKKIVRRIIKVMGKRVECLFHFPNEVISSDVYDFNVSSEFADTIIENLLKGHKSGELREIVYDIKNDLEYDILVTWKLL